MTEETFLRALLNHVQDGIEIPVTAYVGDKVEKVEDIYRSFHTAIMALSFQNFDAAERIRYYSERTTEKSGKIISEEIIEELLKAVEENHRDRIKGIVETVFHEINGADMEPGMIRINMNYLLVRLTHLGLAQDDSVDQNEIISYIRKIPLIPKWYVEAGKILKRLCWSMQTISANCEEIRREACWRRWRKRSGRITMRILP